MITLILPKEVRRTITNSLKRAGRDEIGGILMGTHVGYNEFRVDEITIHQKGTLASFFRKIEDALINLNAFFDRNKRNFREHNYIGEWHSHPSFDPIPSSKDDLSMREIICDPEVGANFAVLLIVKIDIEFQLVATAHTYLPNGEKIRSNLG